METDFRWQHAGSLSILIGVSEVGKDKVFEILSQPETQGWGAHGVAVESRYVEDLQARLEDEGFSF